MWHKIKNDMNEARKNKDKDRLRVISSLFGTIQKIGIDKGYKEEVPNEIVTEAILKEQKTVKEQLETCPKDREDKKTEYQFALNVVNEYAPKLINNEFQIKAMITEMLSDAGIPIDKKSRGMAMKAVMPQLKGKADMSVVNKVMKALFE